METITKYNKEYIVQYKVIPKFDGKFEVIKKEFASIQKNWFLSQTDAINDYNKYYAIAQKKYKMLLNLFEKIKKENDIDFRFDYYLEGDTYGIDKDYGYIEITVNNYDFEFILED